MLRTVYVDHFPQIAFAAKSLGVLFDVDAAHDYRDDVVKFKTFGF